MAIALAAAVTIMAVLAVVPQSLASWIDADHGAGQLQMGQLSLSFAESDGSAVSPIADMASDPPEFTFTSLTTAAYQLLPGDTAFAILRVDNTGDSPLSLTAIAADAVGGSQADNAVAAALRIGVARLASPDCDLTNFAPDAFRPMPSLSSTEPSTFIPGDTALAQGDSTLICIAVRLDPGAAAIAQGGSASVRLGLRADQVR